MDVNRLKWFSNCCDGQWNVFQREFDGGVLMIEDQHGCPISQLQKRWFQAWVDHDKEALEELTADDYVLTTAGEGIQVNKHQWINGAMGRFKQQNYKYDEILTRVYDNAAVVVWSYTEDASHDLIVRLYGREPDQQNTDDQLPNTIQMFMTDVWIRRQDRWQVVSRHASLPARAPRNV